MITEEEKKVLTANMGSWINFQNTQVWTGFSIECVNTIEAIMARELKMKLNRNCTGCMTSGTKMIYKLLENETSA